MLVPYLRLTHEAWQCHGDWDPSQLLHWEAGQHAWHEARSQQLLLLLLMLLLLQHLELGGGVHHGLLVGHHARRVRHHGRHHQAGAGGHHGPHTGRGGVGSRGGRLVLRHGGSHLLLGGKQLAAAGSAGL